MSVEVTGSYRVCVCVSRSALRVPEPGGRAAASGGAGDQAGGLLSQGDVQRGSSLPQDPLPDPG